MTDTITKKQLIDLINKNLNIYKYFSNMITINHNIYIKKLNNINHIHFIKNFENIFIDNKDLNSMFSTFKKDLINLYKTYFSKTDSDTINESDDEIKKIKLYFYIKFELAFRLYYDKEYTKIEKNNLEFINDCIKNYIYNEIDTIKYDDCINVYYKIQQIRGLSFRHNAQKEFGFLNLNPNESIIHIMSNILKTILVILITSLIFFRNLNINKVNNEYYYFALVITGSLILFIFIAIVIITKQHEFPIVNIVNIIKNNWSKIIFLFIFIYIFIIFLEITGFNEYLESISNDNYIQNLESISNDNYIHNTKLWIIKFNYYKAHDPVFRSVFYLLLSLIVLIISYNLGKIVKYGSMIPMSDFNNKKIKIILSICSSLLFISFWLLFNERLKKSYLINTFLSIFISIIIIIFMFGLIKSDYLFRFHKTFNFKQIFELSKNYEPFKEEKKLGEYSNVDINILSEDIALAIDYVSLYKDNIEYIIEPLIKNNKTQLLTQIINKIEDNDVIYKILLYLLNKSNKDGDTIYYKILQKIDPYKIIECSKNYDDLKYINNSLLIKLINELKPILDELI